MPGNAGLRTVSILSGSPGSGGLRTGSMTHANGGGSVASEKGSALEGGPRSGRRSSSRDGGATAAPIAALSAEQLQALGLEYRNLVLDIRDFEALDLQVGALVVAVDSSVPGCPAAMALRLSPLRC